MAILATGPTLAQTVSFNQGTLDVNGQEIAVIQDITIDASVTTKDLRQLGSIKMVTAPKRHGWKPTAKGKVSSINKEFYGFFFGSSGPDGAGTDYTFFDGQTVLTRASINVLMNEGTNLVQFQFTNAIIGGNFSLATKTESFAELSFQIEAQDLLVVTNY